MTCVQRACLRNALPTALQVVLAVAIGLVGPLSAASAVGWGRIRYYQVTSPNHFFFFQLENISTDHPSCATSQRFVVDLTSAAGPAIASAIISAKETGRNIAAYGLATCSVWSDAEDVAWIETMLGGGESMTMSGGGGSESLAGFESPAGSGTSVGPESVTGVDPEEFRRALISGPGN